MFFLSRSDNSSGFEFRCRGFRVELLVILVLVFIADLPAAALQSVEVSVFPLTTERFRVELEMNFDAVHIPEREEFRHFALRRGDVEISAISARTTERALQVNLRERPSQWGLEIAIPEPVDRYTIEYQVSLGEATRIPVFVPAAPVEGPVRIRVRSAEQFDLYGTSFPRFSANGETWTAALGNLPSFLILPLRERDSGGLLERMLSVAFVTDAILIAILVLASLYWWRLRRRALRTLSEPGPPAGGGLD